MTVEGAPECQHEQRVGMWLADLPSEDGTMTRVVDIHCLQCAALVGVTMSAANGTTQYGLAETQPVLPRRVIFPSFSTQESIVVQAAAAIGVPYTEDP